MFKEPNKLDLLSAENEAQRGSARPTEEVLHELEVLQIELKKLRSELSRARIIIKESRESYVSLYDFAPVSYITLTKTGQISAINFAGVALLGGDRKRILGHYFSSYVASEDQDQWHGCFELAIKQGGKICCEIRCHQRDGTIFDGFLDCKPIKTNDKVLALHVTLTDITEKKQTEAARRQFEMLINKLTNREREVLALALSGISNKAISTRLQISQRMVENHRSRIHSKTGIVSLLELAQQAARAGVKLAEIAHPSNDTTI